MRKIEFEKSSRNCEAAYTEKGLRDGVARLSSSAPVGSGRVTA
jgi:hypothetical protein